jgi:hypothetical protein
MKTLARMYRGQYRAVGEALETWKADHDEAMAVHDLEEIIRTCLGLHDRTRELVRAAWDLGFAGNVGDPDGLGRCVLKALEAGVEAWGGLQESVEITAAAGYAVDGAGRVPAALAEARVLAADFAARWPFARKEDIERGEMEIKAGKFVAGEGLLRELQGRSD